MAYRVDFVVGESFQSVGEDRPRGERGDVASGLMTRLPGLCSVDPYRRVSTGEDLVLGELGESLDDMRRGLGRA